MSVAAGRVLWGVGALPLCLAFTERAVAQDAVDQDILRRTWRMEMRAEQLWDSNVRFVEEGPGDEVQRVGGGGSLTLHKKRTDLSLLAHADATHYGELLDQNAHTYALAGELTRLVTPRLSAHLGGQLRTDVSRGAVTEIGPQVGPPLPLYATALSRTRSATASTAYRFSPRMTGSVGASYSTASFDRPELIGGTTIEGMASLSRRYSAKADFRLSGTHSQIRTDDAAPSRSDNVDGSWEATFGQVTTRLGIGATRYQVAEQGPSRTQVSGEASLRRRMLRGEMSLDYRRSVEQAYGLGRALTTDAAAIDYTRTMFRELGVRLSAGRAWYTDPIAPAGRLHSDALLADLERPLFWGLGLDAGVFLRQREADVLVASRGARVALHYAGPRR